ncbi:MAG: peroxiredoxin family protein [Planctomycetes bacterium]|nr:peroxiredoxin family protein [Planctomycetota bacterium]MCH9724211.1 peroxiredoxin family protein [Planctomycetota bacterium]MCH9778922.1 peroxiredoxin family protein [Planctomycetota bacterium]MCH9793591.1 peroxiredoxin family protein [Planctomycetota bacterium]MDF1745898.1 redoxin domain-containing protein [Gimesia sp.]
MLPYFRIIMISLSGSCLLFAGCSESAPAPANDANLADNQPMSNGYGYGAVEDIIFQDSLKSNASVEQSFSELKFIDTNGKPVQLSEFIGKKNLVLVFTRGFAGSICPYCATQTSRLISNYESITKRNAEVIVVYPLSSDTDIPRWDEFLAATRAKLSSPESPVPFPVLLDIKLDAVNQLGIQDKLAKPATYIVDTQGQIRFAYVGSTLADRPSIKAMLEQLDKLNPVTPVTEDKSSK